MPYKSKIDLYKAQKRHREKVRLEMYTFLSSKACIDCGENDPIVLDFDHRNPKEKTKNVAKFLSGHYSWGSVLKEIEKCDIRCANCHRKKSHQQFGYYGRKSLL